MMTPKAPAAAPPTGAGQLRDFALGWFRALNEKAPAESMVAMLVPAGLVMDFPGAPINGLAEFRAWYHDVTHTYFDQDHRLGRFEPVIAGDEARISLTVTWLASTWTAPDARSEQIAKLVTQEWVVRGLESGRPVIAEYRVVDLVDAPPAQPASPIGQHQLIRGEP